MKIKFHNWFRNKQSWWFAILPEATITYASLGGYKTTTINVGWLFWTATIYLENYSFEKMCTQAMEE